MTSIITRRTAFRFLFALVLFVFILAYFWTSSRYPSLDDKALMGGSIQLEDPLSFEAHWPVDPLFPLWKKILFTTGNWLHTNRQGMTFGVLIGACFLTLIRYVQRVSFRNSFLNSTLGLLIGAPLGVCVNCAAPVAKGLYSGGVRAETALATMIASPTLNIVVLSMLFSILPFYLAITKLVLSLIVIMFGIPLICRFLPASQLQLSEDQQRSCPLPEPKNQETPETVSQGFQGFLRDYVSDLWYIIKLTVPLMVLAGFLGAIAATLLPIELLSDLRFGILLLIGVALIGTFLPVPIAFDVVICGALLAAGLNVGYVMTLLFTLGIFSIYSFFIIGQSISLRAASLIGGLVIVIGVGAGLGIDQWHGLKTKQALEQLVQSEPMQSPKTENPTAASSAQLQERNASAPTPRNFQITLKSKAFETRSAAGEKLFTRMEARDIGIVKPIEFSFKDMWPPFWEGRSISVGDYDRDGDPDVILASTQRGLYFYENTGSGKFKQKTFPLGELSSRALFNAALVDLNNDGWLDIFTASYRSGNAVLWNKNGTFSGEHVTPVKNQNDAMLSLALSFADADKDGDLDVALGNWAAGWYRRVPGEESRNRIIFNENGQLDGTNFKNLPGVPGETLSILFTDINDDGNSDLLVGNDFEIPDVYYYGDGTGQFDRILASENKIPMTTTTTMSIKNDDLNNDLLPEIYLAQIAGRSSGIKGRLKMQPIEDYCRDIRNSEDKQACQKNMEIKSWYKSGNNFDPSYARKCQQFDGDYQTECKAMLVKDLAIQGDDSEICELIKADQVDIRAYCDMHFKPFRPFTQADVKDSYPQIKRRNILLMPNRNGSFSDQSVSRGLEVGGWSWDTKIGDFNNDEWPDVYIVNGTWVPNEFTPSNMFFLNKGRGMFEEAARHHGLEDYLMTASAAQFDMDNDGDLDVITVPVNGPVMTFLNNSQSGNAINFSVEDKIGNYYGIGTKFTIFYGDGDGEEKRQMREIQMGGGFQSFDHSVAHFGIGEYEAVSRVVINWADGSRSEINETLNAGATYTIDRVSTP